MENITTYNISEWLALIFSVLIGSGAYIGFVYIKNKLKISFGYMISVIMINLCVTYIAFGVIKNMNWGKWSSPALTMVAFVGQYIIDYIDRRYLKIGDSMIKKAGFNINNNENENNDNTTEENDS